jgi:protein O-GlcNAc transferase
VSWLGYFATTGLPEMDYFLSDPHLSPMSDPGHFTEKLWRLAETWLCLKPPVHGVPVSPLPALENGFLTFGSFGNLSKMNDEVVETWSSVLHGVSASKLFLKSKQFVDFVQVQEVKTRFEKYDISSDRLILEGPETLKGYFEAYQKVDIILDTFPYPGGTTSVDSLWMGVPVLTLKGDRFLSRLGESIAINAGNSDWIAADLNDYIGKAVQFASDLDRLAQLRSTLRERVLRSPLFDTPRFAKNFGKALWGMWNQPPSTKF